MNAPTAIPDQSKPVPPYRHTPLFPLGPDTTPYRKISSEGARVEKVLGKEMLDPRADRKSTRLNSSHSGESRMPSSA